MRESPTSWKCCIMMSAIGNGAPLSLPSRCMWPTSFMPPTRAKPGSSLVGTNLSFATAFAYPATSNAYHLHCIHNRTNSRAKPAMASCISSNSIVRPPPQCLYIRGSNAPLRREKLLCEQCMHTAHWQEHCPAQESFLFVCRYGTLIVAGCATAELRSMH